MSISSGIWAIMLALSACSSTISSTASDLCDLYMEPALAAVELCLGKMEESLSPKLPENFDTVSIDVFDEGFDLGFSRGRLARHGGDRDNLRMYMVCMVSIDRKLITGHFYTYDHWPPDNELLDFDRSDGRYIERFFGPPHVPAFSEKDDDARPLVSMVFERFEEGVRFTECIETPEVSE